MKNVQSWVYFVQLGGSGPVKIGTARNVRQRIAGLQTGTIETLRLIAVIPGGRNEEKALHQRFSEYRLRGEWFEFGPGLAELIDAADPTEAKGLTARRGAERATEDIASAAWFDKALSVEEALDRMPGWTFATAYYHFGKRGVPFQNASERAKKMAAKRWAKAEPGVVKRWTSPGMKREHARWSQHWRDPSFRNDEDAFQNFPPELRDEFGSPTTARRVFGARRPGDKSAGGRPARKAKPKR